MKKANVESKEMYLKSIYNIQRYEHKEARPIDVSKYLNVSKASVSEMLKKLRKQKLISHKAGGSIRLTKAGIKSAKKISYNHKVLSKFFRDVLKLPEDKATKEACNLEHFFSDETIAKIKKHTEASS